MRTEFEFIHNIKNKYGLKHIGDDCAVLPKDAETDMVITADMLVEDIDFRLDWATPDTIAHKALAVSLSDIAAMGGTPKWSLLSLAVPESLWNSNFVDAFYTSWHYLAVKFDVELVGGDVSRSPDKFVIDSVVGGEVEKGKAVLRSGARVGNIIAVTGQLGGAAGGLELLKAGRTYKHGSSGPEFELMDRQLCPTPQLNFGEIFAEQGVSAMIDISDGLSSDLFHICEASGVGARIYSERIPVDPNLSAIDAGVERALELALNGGEDFELLFTSDEKNISDAHPSLFTVIGEVTANVGVIELICNEQTQILQPKGYRHF